MGRISKMAVGFKWFVIAMALYGYNICINLSPDPCAQILRGIPEWIWGQASARVKDNILVCLAKKLKKEKSCKPQASSLTSRILNDSSWNYETFGFSGQAPRVVG